MIKSADIHALPNVFNTGVARVPGGAMMRGALELRRGRSELAFTRQAGSSPRVPRREPYLVTYMSIASLRVAKQPSI
jgi:hypothetical protein